ncbi:ferritin [Oceanidesulfovibrio marinus]|uniref:Ferritin n=1 Tax=Oceanidesulfovibrio marinus TaxID=370038 RepID=A0A6P1ZDQ8_9BACT|nr:ferritin [Oceanidesulfovibrio marinus]QJT07771.1 ferritin [Oceanidesulfovibrio marinus]TVM30220.1 ferritin [Oceanidesulfovibrio marinus]
MLNETMNDALNEQVKWEFYSSFLYLAMAAYCAEQGLPGCASWMRLQADEERMHAMKFYDFILERGGSVRLHAIDEPKGAFDSMLDVFEYGLSHEREVTRRINELVNLAMDQRDHATSIFLQWFVTEQVEEEDNFSDVVARFRLVGNKGEGLFMLDKELGGRAPAPAAE